MTSGDGEPQRLQKVLARAGVGSRRSIEEMIRAGRIRINGQQARLGDRVDRYKDKVEIDGSRVPLAADLEYYLVNKPVGVVSTADDPEGRPTIVDLVDTATRVWPVGRLDVDSEGALIVTNDGDLALGLTHPRYGVAKTYLCEVDGSLDHASVRALREGVELDDGVTAPAHVRLVERGVRSTLVEMTLTEGRNREVRRMIEAVGHRTRRLVRTQIGPLKLGRLKSGSARSLTDAEVRALYAAIAGPGVK
ncbi:MAG: rRNA pseudouridine synthase [Actinomycetota bacterium]|nr:rRNA pseudouridine synthase [Actinomycetota bacterium]